MPDELQQLLFTRLSTIFAESAERPNRRENLVDVLEIMAVFTGLKPAHLSGQGLHSEKLIGQITKFIGEFGLYYFRTPTIRAFRDRLPLLDPLIVRWEDECAEAARRNSPQILWIYRVPSLHEVILDTAEGRIDCATALGYPKCCVHYDSEQKNRLLEEYVAGLKRKFKPQNDKEIIHLLEIDEYAEIDDSKVDLDRKKSFRSFPYVEFFACPNCISTATSPASKINRAMRDLAFSLSPLFGRDIWMSSYGDSTPSGRNAFPRNHPCPCGSGKKFKQCCSLIID